MKTLQDRFDEQLEQTRTRTGSDWQYLSGFTRFAPGKEHDLEIENLLILARNLKSARQVKVSPVFARQMERRLLRRFAELRLRKRSTQRSSFSLFRARPVFASILSFCLLLLVFSAGTLAYAAQVSNPANPLYSLKQLEQHLQVSLANDPGTQASLDLQFARERLNTLSTLANRAHGSDYIEALTDFQQQVQTTTSAVNSLPAGSQRQQFGDQLADLQRDAVRALRAFLPELDLSARLATTDTLAFLGERVPRLSSGTLTITLHPDQSATLRLSGANLPSGARLLLDGKLLEVTGTLQNGQLLFIIPNWDGKRHPRSLGVLAPDGTAAQTTAITIVTSNGTSSNNGTNNNGNGNGSNGNGNKPKTTPTPHR
ncbi:MAG TPA: DUF5667 domain-containing protein [Ktedonobacteraceae bacterium]